MYSGQLCRKSATLVSGPTPRSANAAAEPRGAVVDLALRDPAVALHDGGRVGDGVGHPLPHRREALVHGGDSMRRFGVDLAGDVRSAPMPRRRSRDTAFEARHNAKIAPHQARPPMANATPVPRNSVLLDTP